MTNYHLNAFNPASKKNYYKQQADFLALAKQRSKVEAEAGSDGAGIQFLNYVGGRGCAKTTTAIFDMFNVALVEAPTFRTAWTARSNGEIDNVLLNELERIVPSDLYTVSHKNGARYILWISGHKTFLVSRNVDNPKKRTGLGFNVIGIWHDEAATGFNAKKFSDLNNAIREPGAPFYFCVTTSTPLPNAYQSYCQNADCTTIVASSYDNPFLNKSNLNSMASQMDELTIAQELYGKFLVTTGRLWDKFEEKTFPDGNIIEDYEFDFDKPFFIGVDLGGAQSALQIVQYVDPLDPITGRRLYDGKLAVVVAEYVPNNVGLEEVCNHIIDRFCQGDHVANAPECVLVGHDVNSQTIMGVTGADYFKQLGWRFDRPRGYMFRKENQRIAIRSLILNRAGERRLAVSAIKNKFGTYEIKEQFFGTGKQRGILNVMRNDTYSENDDVFYKDKSKAGVNALEDDRDALAYWVSCNHPLSTNVHTKILK